MSSIFNSTYIKNNYTFNNLSAKSSDFSVLSILSLAVVSLSIIFLTTNIISLINLFIITSARNSELSSKPASSLIDFSRVLFFLTLDPFL